MTPAFLPYCITVNLNANNGTDALRRLVDTLKADVYEDQLAAADTGTTGADGSVTFTGLEQGLYLVLATQIGKDGDDSYKPTANLISLPTVSADGSAWQYAVETNIKCTYERAQEPEPTPTPTPTPEPSEEPTPTPEPSEEPTPSPEPPTTETMKRASGRCGHRLLHGGIRAPAEAQRIRYGKVEEKRRSRSAVDAGRAGAGSGCGGLRGEKSV